MEWEKGHQSWRTQLQKLLLSKSELKETAPLNILVHFFTQVVESEFTMELDANKTILKQLLRNAIEIAPKVRGSPRKRAVVCMCSVFRETILDKIRLADLRNVIVFEIYKRCGITLDTYFERYPSPPGTEAQNIMYSKIAHGNAVCTADIVSNLSQIMVYMFFLKRVFVVYDIITEKNNEMQGNMINWIGHAWACHVETTCLSDLIWSTFLDLWAYEQHLHK